ncbi:hypothetical protein GQ44DRAFT_713861 [Phaeosphaeriaceae sp. PMI808]|nr:hypothetical protein GQ44DRAFT_713861 [Phaeosphaeriaceae sp. PMI808]
MPVTLGVVVTTLVLEAMVMPAASKHAAYATRPATSLVSVPTNLLEPEDVSTVVRMATTRLIAPIHELNASLKALASCAVTMDIWHLIAKSVVSSIGLVCLR